ncbi:MAG: hypothetical protein ACE5OS_00645 [Anaerolineae bacterium]
MYHSRKYLPYKRRVLAGGRVGVKDTELRPGWTSYTKANYVRDPAFDRDDNLWAVGDGGVVRLIHKPSSTT